MAKYDLTTKNCRFLDRHLTFPLLEFLYSKEIYDQKDLLEFILDTASKTNMIDYTMDTRRRLNMNESEMPAELTTRKMNILATLKQLQEEVEPIMKATENLKEDYIKDSKMFVEILHKEYNFNEGHLKSIYKLAKYLYECGNYQESISYLYFCLIVMRQDDDNYESVLWGKLAAEILTLNWNSALEDLNRLREYIDNSTSFTPVQLLQKRAWLIQWSVLIFNNHPKGRDIMIDLYMYAPMYFNAIQTLCPHVLRYLATAVVINHGRRNVFNDFIKILQQETYNYRDPITEFLECLCVQFDFEKARLMLAECQMVIINDFFIVGCLNDFIEHARLLIFETFCRIHQCISISMLADKLNMTPDEAECWIVHLIRNAGLNATIDSKLGYIKLKSKPRKPHEQLTQKVDMLRMRSEQLVNLVESRSKQLQNKEPNESWTYC